VAPGSTDLDDPTGKEVTEIEFNETQAGILVNAWLLARAGR
jgi:hypothetical protein